MLLQDAVGLGNIWRFPYLAAKDGGGTFILVYIVLALTFGFTLLTTDIAIGRKTGQSPLVAYGKIHPGWNGLGLLASIVPVVILPYYCSIGGWVLKISVCVSHRTWHCCCRGWLLYRLYYRYMAADLCGAEGCADVPRDSAETFLETLIFNM